MIVEACTGTGKTAFATALGSEAPTLYVAATLGLLDQAEELYGFAPIKGRREYLCVHEKKIAHLADTIASKLTRPRLILISGPSGSGKTTFSKRLAIQMSVNGLKNATVSLDNYFLDREETPRDDTGEYDFEAPDAIDIELLNHVIRGHELHGLAINRFSPSFIEVSSEIDCGNHSACMDGMFYSA